MNPGTINLVLTMRKLLVIILIIPTTSAWSQPIFPTAFAGHIIAGLLTKEVAPNYFVFNETPPEKPERVLLNHRFDSVSKAIAKNEQNSHLYFERGMVRKRLGAYQSAEDDFEKAWQLGNRSREFLMNYGELNCYLGAYTNSIRCFNLVLKKDTADAEAYLKRGITKLFLKKYRTQGDILLYTNSIPDFTSALNLNPDLAEALILRGYARVQLEFYQDAIPDLERAIELNPKNEISYSLLGESYLKSNQPSLACETFKKAAANGFEIKKKYILKACHP
jgi:tetratricopeptide (TPR) repeat protein